MKRFCVLLVLCLLLTACSSEVGRDPEPENRLVIGTPLPERVFGPLVREFEARTGIWVRVVTGSAEALLDSGACDLLLGVDAEFLTEHSDAFAPAEIQVPDTVPESFCCADGSWVPLISGTVVLIYNPMLVRVNPPTGFASLLDPAWRGKIAFGDPQKSPAAYTQLVTLTVALEEEPERLIRAFRENLHGMRAADDADVVSLVAEGTCYIGLAMEENALEAKRNGNDIAVVYPQEGTCIAVSGMAVPADSKHGDNARRFAEFALGKDAQTVLLRDAARLPARWDVKKPDEDCHILDYDVAEAVARRDTLLRQWEAAL